MKDNIKGDRLSLVQFGTEPYPNDVLLNFQNVYTSEKMMIVISKKEFYMPSGTHFHSDYEFYFPFVEGQPHIFGSKTIVLNKNRVVPINPFLAHGLAREVPRFSAMDIMMNKDYVEDLSMSVFGHRQIEFECNEYKVSPELENLIRLFIDESKHVQSGTSFAQQCLAMLIVINFFRCFRSNRSFPLVERNYRENEGIKRVIEYMNDEHCSDYSLDEAASLANISRYHFIRVFKAFTGKTPYNYMMDIKIEKAKKMLKCTPDNITSIAAALGFSSPAHFNSVFKRKTGVSPQKYRKECLS